MDCSKAKRLKKIDPIIVEEIKIEIRQKAKIKNRIEKGIYLIIAILVITLSTYFVYVMVQ